MKSKRYDLPILAADDRELKSDIIFDSARNSFSPLLEFRGNTRFLGQTDRRFFLFTLVASASMLILSLWKSSAEKSHYKAAMFARRI